MIKTSNISGSGQIFSLLVLSQSFWLLCYRPPLANGLLTLAASAVVCGVIFPLTVFCRRRAAIEKPLPRCLSVGGALLAAGYFSVTAAGLLSAARVIFEGAFSPLLLLLVLLVTVLAAAAAGQEALGRAAFIGLFLFLAAALLMILRVLPQGTILNLRPPERDLSRFGSEILYLLPRQAELLLLLTFSPRINRPHSAALLLWVPAGWLLNGLLLVLSALVLGHCGSLLCYPLHVLAQSAGLSGMVPVYCFLLLSAAFFRLSGLAAAALRLGGGTGARSKPVFWTVALSGTVGIVLLYYTGWAETAVYAVLGIAGLLWLLLCLFCPARP